jgi:Ca2+-binding RTX toxin-like protein
VSPPNSTANPTGVLGIALDPIRFFGGKAKTMRVTPGKTLRGTAKNDILKGTKKNDVLDSRQQAKTTSTDKLYGLAGNDRLIAGNGNDYLSGDRGNDILNSGKGRDLLLGGEGTDKLLGGWGNDILNGGSEADILMGGQGKDMFVFDNVNDGVNIITDFNGNEDVIDLRSIFSQAQYSGITPYAQYLKHLKLVSVGSGTEVQIDADGNGSGMVFKTLVKLENVGIAAIDSRHLVIG